MCEIAILNDEEYSAERLADIAMQIYRSMRTSLGIVSIINDESEPGFDYNIVKSMNPDGDDVVGYFETMADRDNVTKYIIHGRLATTGNHDLRAAHPIDIDCAECDIEYVLHNGHVFEDDTIREEYTHDHEYTTAVDTESIAHLTGSVPASPEDREPHFDQEPCYILLGNESYFVHSTRAYDMDASGQLAKPYRSFGPSGGSQTDLVFNA